MKIEIKKTVNLKPVEIAEKIGDDIFEYLRDCIFDLIQAKYNLNYDETVDNMADLSDEETAEILQLIVDGFKADMDII